VRSPGRESVAESVLYRTAYRGSVTETGSSSVENVQASATRRSYVFIFVPVLFLFVFTAITESDKWLHALDDEIIVVALVGALLYFLVTRKLGTASELAPVNRVGLIVAAIVVAAGILAIVLEFTDPNDIGDDPQTVIGGVLAVINGLLLMAAAGPRVPEEAGSYAVEWTRIRTTFWFSSFFLVTFVFFALPPYPSFSVGVLPAYAEVVVLLIAGVVGLWALVRSRREANPASLRTYNNIILVLAIVLAVLAFSQFDIGTLPLAVLLIVNRFV
jgi:uncharacterized membrane protein HdeD (DUF308 family)